LLVVFGVLLVTTGAGAGVGALGVVVVVVVHPDTTSIPTITTKSMIISFLI
jgi:hypothetical protein